MIQYPRRPIETDDHRNNQKRRRHNPNRISITQSNRKDRACKLPRGGIEGIAEPVGDQSPHGPFAVFTTNGIEI